MKRTDTSYKILWLSRARGIELEIETLKSAYQKAFDNATSITAKSSLAGGGGSDPHKFDKVSISADQIKRQIAKCQRVKAEIIKAIGNLSSPVQRTILFDYYVQGMNWGDISAQTNYSIRQAHRLHDKALEELVIPRKKDGTQCHP